MRPHPRLLVLAALGLALAGCDVRLKRGSAARPAVTSFDIEGARGVSAGDLKSRLVTQASDGFFWRFLWRETRYFDEDAFANDKRRILRYYQSQGYYGAKIVSSEVVPEGDGFVKVVVRVDEGKPARVVELTVGGLEAAPEARAKLGQEFRRLPLRRGDVFTEAAYDAARQFILSALTSTGWAKAEVAQGAEVDPARAEVRVNYAATPGERYRFGEVHVAGAAAIPRARIREEAEEAVKPGQIFDETALGKAQARVYDLGVFGGVRVSEARPDPAKKTIPVVVAIREAPFRTIRAGPGITIQANRQEVDVIAGWAHRNWFGGLRKLSLDARGGYAWIPNTIKPLAKGFVGLATADFTQPGVLTRRVDLNVRAEAERGLEQAYDFFAERLRFGTPIRFGRLLTIVPSLNLELYQFGGGGRQAIPQGEVTNANLLTLRTCPGHNPQLCLLSYLEQRFIVDLRDDVINTRRGFYFSLSIQEGFSAFGNGSSYLRLLPEARAFASLPFGFVLAGRARVGLVEALRGSTDVPIVARFTSGGPNYMRGYYTRDLSPVFFVRNKLEGCTDLQNLPGQPDPVCRAGTYVPVGGNGLIDGSIELRFPLGGNWTGATYLDFGNVRHSVAESLNVANLQYAAGIGVRYNTLFGPLRIDVAAKLPKPTSGDVWPGVQVVNITEAGTVSPSGAVHHDPIVSVHLTIGEAF